MKKTYNLRFTLALLVAMLTGAANLQAQTAYNLWICGEQVTDANKDDLTVINDNKDRIVTGTVRYHPETKTLELYNATISSKHQAVAGIKPEDTAPIISKIDGLTIEVLGSYNKVNDERKIKGIIAIDLHEHTTIRGKGRLSVTGKGTAIYVRDALTVKEECYLAALGAKCGILGFGTVLNIDATYVMARGFETGSIVGFANYEGTKNLINLNGCKLPSGMQIIGGDVCDADGNIVKGSFTIAPKDLIKYDLWIGGMQVTSFNKDRLNELRCVTEGNVTYNPETKTLRLENATIDTGKDYLGYIEYSYNDDTPIYSKIDGLTIEVVGDNTLKAADGDGIFLYNSYGGPGDMFSATIRSNSDGTLNVTAPSTAIWVNGIGELTIESCTVNAVGGNRGIADERAYSGGIYKGGTLNINSANVTATGSGDGSIAYFDSINLDKCTITEPADAQITNGTITDASGNTIKSRVKISAELYDLRICGVQVTATNKDNLNTIPCVSGTVNYNPDTKTLRLENAVISTTGNVNAIRSDIDSLKIEVIGNNTVNSNGWAAIQCNKNGFIEGGGTLNVTNAADDYAIYAKNSSLTIKNCIVNATGGKRGITGSGNIGTLTVENAAVTAKGTSEGSITHFYRIILTDCVVSEPAGAVISKGADNFTAVRDADGNIIKETVKIVPASTYNLWICGTQVTALNKDNLSVIEGVTGSVSYNSYTKTLRLENAAISATGNVNAIRSDIEDLKIEVVGNNNTVNSNGWAAIQCNKNSFIQGNGTLNVNNPADDYAIYARNSSLTIKNCIVNATGSKRGITGSGNIGTLTIDNAAVTAKGTSEGSITHFYRIKLIGCAISEPADAVISKGADSFNAVRDADGNTIKETVKITAFYNLKICGVQVTSLNKDNLRVIPGVDAGKVKYNPDTKTLRLENATISTTGEVNAIRSGIEGLNIQLIGTNTVTSNGWAAIQFDTKSGTITGGGMLTVNNSAYDYAIYAKNTSLTIKNCVVNATGGKRGITGSGNTGTLTIDNATVTASGTGEGSITQFANIILNNVAVLEPAGAIVSKGADTFRAVRDVDGNIIKGTVKMSPATAYKLWICGVPVTSLNKDNLAVISGVSSGTVNYNPDTYTLRLDNAAITGVNDVGAIRSEIEGVNIEVIGENTVTINGVSAIKFYENSGTIMGSGTLTVTNQANDFAIYAQNTSLTIKDCTVNATGGKRGITGSGVDETLYIENATVTAKGNTEGSITHFANIFLDGCVISKPVGADVSKGADAFYAVRDASGNIITETVKIEPETTYELWVCGVQVNSLNKYNIAAAVGSADGTVTGSVSYDPVSYTLTLDNATITAAADKRGIESWIENLTIELKGNNTITTTNRQSVLINKNFTIQGSSGSDILNINSLEHLALNPYNCQLTIKNCTLNAVSSTIGIVGSGSTVTIENATVSATGTSDASISVANLILIGCAITQPADAEYNATQKAVCYKNTNNKVKETVKITPTGPSTGIDEPNTQAITLYPNPVKNILHIKSEQAVTAIRIYSVDGTYVTHAAGENISEINISRLPAGIYMVRAEAGERVSVVRIVKE